MEHADFKKNEAVERYLLDEMTSDERNVFEEHYFDCRICAAEVSEGTRMLAAGRVVAREDEAEKVVRMPQRWIPITVAASLATALLGGGAGYQYAVRRSDARVLPAAVSIHQFRNESAPKTLRPGGVLAFDIIESEECPAERYIASIRRGNDVQHTYDIGRERAADEVLVTVPGELPAGRYELLIEGVRKDGNRCEISTDPLVVGER